MHIGQRTVVPAHDMKAYRERVHVYLHLFLVSGLDGGRWSTSGLRCFFPRQKNFIYWLGSWVGRGTSLDVWKNRIRCPCRDSNVDRPFSILTANPNPEDFVLLQYISSYSIIYQRRLIIFVILLFYFDCTFRCWRVYPCFQNSVWQICHKGNGF